MKNKELSRQFRKEIHFRLLSFSAVSMIFFLPAMLYPAPIIKPVKSSATTVQENITYRKSIVKYALSLIGTPYKYGGNTRNGFDCCGFVMYVYSHNGIKIPRTARDQFAAGKKIDKKNIKKGDLLFYKLNGASVSHVGIYIGDRSFIHSPVPGTTVRVEKIDGQYWTTHFAGAATFLND